MKRAAPFNAFSLDFVRVFLYNYNGTGHSVQTHSIKEVLHLSIKMTVDGNTAVKHAI